MALSKAHNSHDRPLRVLVVDDIPVNRLIAGKLMRALGCDVVEVHGGEAALEMLRADAFDVILLDLHMPAIDGYAVTSAVRSGEAGDPDTPIIAITADVSSEKRCREHGMDGWLMKPLRLHSLREAVRGLRPVLAAAIAV